MLGHDIESDHADNPARVYSAPGKLCLQTYTGFDAGLAASGDRPLKCGDGCDAAPGCGSCTTCRRYVRVR